MKLAEAWAERRVREASCTLDAPAGRYMRRAARAAFRPTAALAADPCYGPRLIAHIAADGFFTELARQAALVRCLFPFHPVTADPYTADPSAVVLSARMYYTRDFTQLPALAVTDAAMLAHCRSGGPHARGCWVVDALLGVGWQYTPDTSSGVVTCSR